MRRIAPLALMFPLLLGACRGPLEPLEVVAKDIPTDTVLGRKIALQAPPPQLNMIQGALDIPALPARARDVAFPKPTLPAGFCLPGNPLLAPEYEARNNIAGPPKEATYDFRGLGFTFRGAGSPNAQVVQYPLNHKRTVQAVTMELPGSFTFEVLSDYGTVGKIVSKFRVVPSGVSSPGWPTALGQERNIPGYPPGADVRPSTGVQSGLYLVSMASEGVNFRLPDPGVLLMMTPIINGQRFQTTATDGNLIIKFTSVVGPQSRADACGVPLDVWTLELKDLTFSEVDKRSAYSASTGLPATIKYKIGPQYGGLIVQEDTLMFGAEGFDPALLPACALRVTPSQTPEQNAVALALCSSGGLGFRQTSFTINSEPKRL